MNKRLGPMIALALAGVLLLAEPGLAQQQGGEAAGPVGQGNQLCTPGPGGTCVVNPNKPGNQNTPGGNFQRRRGQKGQRGPGRMNQPDTQVNPPAANQ